METRHTRDAFLTLLAEAGFVGYDLDVRARRVTVRTKYQVPAYRIQRLAEALGLRVLRTLTDDGTHVLGITHFRAAR